MDTITAQVAKLQDLRWTADMNRRFDEQTDADIAHAISYVFDLDYLPRQTVMNVLDKLVAKYRYTNPTIATVAGDVIAAI